MRITDRATEKLFSIRPQGKSLRISVFGGGCSGMSYKLDWIESALATNEDEMNMSGTLLYLIDPKSAVYLTGAELDFNEDMNDYGFKWTNLNAKKRIS